MPKTKRTKRPSGPQTNPAECEHSTLRLDQIQIAERCPDCWHFVISDGRAFETATEAGEAAPYQGEVDPAEVERSGITRHIKVWDGGIVQEYDEAFIN